jgi:hypothetical protein
MRRTTLLYQAVFHIYLVMNRTLLEGKTFCILGVWCSLARVWRILMRFGLNLAKVPDSPKTWKQIRIRSSSSCATLKTCGNFCKIGVPLLSTVFGILKFNQ